MTFHKIELQSWPRRDTFRHFMDELPCTYSMCVDLDISALLPAVRERGYKLFPAVLFGLCTIINRHCEFRMSCNEAGELGYYDLLQPCYAVFHSATEGFTNVWTEYEDRFPVFYDRYQKDMQRYGGAAEIHSKPAENGALFNVSCIPWVSFSGFNLNLQKGYDYLLPIFTIGKYRQDGSRTLLPLAIQAHHAVCDGYHTARFVNELQEWMDHFRP